MISEEKKNKVKALMDLYAKEALAENMFFSLLEDVLGESTKVEYIPYWYPYNNFPNYNSVAGQPLDTYMGQENVIAHKEA